MRLFEHKDHRPSPRASIFEATETYYVERVADLCERARVDPKDLATRLSAVAHAAARIRVYRDLDLRASSMGRDAK